MRIFNNYGTNMNPSDGRVVSNFIVQALQDKEITIYGDGTQTRSFCYVDDLINGMILLMNSQYASEPVNLGNPVEYTMIDLAKEIIELTNSSSQLTFLPLPENDPIRRKPDISLANNKLGWKPSVDLQAGLKQTINYFESILTKSVPVEIL